MVTGHGNIYPLTPNDPYRCRTAPLTSKRCILYIYSTNIGAEYFKHCIYSPSFFCSSKCSLFHNSKVFGSCIIQILYTGCAKTKKKKFRRQKLKSYLHRHKISGSPACYCKTWEQTVDHILYDCKLLTQERDSLKAAVLRTENWPESKNELFNKFNKNSKNFTNNIPFDKL